MPATPEDIKEVVREQYGAAARRAMTAAPCCAGKPAVPAASACCEPAGFGASAYTGPASDEIPETIRLASLGCGNPAAIAGLRPGQRVLDLGSGGGLDVFLAARRVGPQGFVYGLDMTDEMLQLARANQRQTGVSNAEFIKGDIEAIPLPDASVDVVISNCVINLSTDKPAVFREARRVLVPGGQFAVTDIVALRPPSEQEQADLAAWAECLAGAITADEYRAGLEVAGFTAVEVTPTHRAGPNAVSAVIRATA